MRYPRLLPVLLGLLLVPIGAATEPGEDRAWREERRTFSFQAAPDGFRAQSDRSSALGEDELVVRYDVATATLHLRYVSTEPGNETLRTVSIAFLALVEFRDQTGDGRYAFGDEEVQRLAIADLDATLIAEPFLNGGRLVTVAYTLPRPDDDEQGPLPITGQPELIPGQFTLRFLLLPTPHSVDGRLLTPLDAHIQTEIERFPYSAADTRVALETRLDSNVPLRAEDATLRAEEGFFTTILEWDESASSTVLSHHGPTRGPTFVAFAFPQDGQTSHEMTLGMSRHPALVGPIVERLLRGDPLAYGLGALAAIVLVAVPSYRRLREG